MKRYFVTILLLFSILGSIYLLRSNGASYTKGLWAIKRTYLCKKPFLQGRHVNPETNKSKNRYLLKDDRSVQDRIVRQKARKLTIREEIEELNYVKECRDIIISIEEAAELAYEFVLVNNDLIGLTKEQIEESSLSWFLGVIVGARDGSDDILYGFWIGSVEVYVSPVEGEVVSFACFGAGEALMQEKMDKKQKLPLEEARSLAEEFLRRNCPLWVREEFKMVEPESPLHPGFHYVFVWRNEKMRNCYASRPFEIKVTVRNDVPAVKGYNISKMPRKVYQPESISEEEAWRIVKLRYPYVKKKKASLYVTRSLRSRRNSTLVWDFEIARDEERFLGEYSIWVEAYTGQIVHNPIDGTDLFDR